MIHFSVTFFVTLLWLTGSAIACKYDDYTDENWAFVRVISRSDRSPFEKLDAVRTACQELDTSYWSGSFAQYRQGVKSAIGNFVWPIMRTAGYLPAAFSKLGGTETQETFKRELETIRPFQDPIIRIQKVYELVGKFQGRYDDRSFGGGMPYIRPGTLLNKAATDGYGGQCRDYALLLYWSLLQVARHPDDKNGLGGLSEKSFSMEPAYGDGTYGNQYVGFHEWVRVNLPRRDPKTNSVKFEHFDLDTTWYSGKFVPLMPRHQNLSKSELTSRATKCAALQKCLAIESIKDQLGKLEQAFARKSSPCP